MCVCVCARRRICVRSGVCVTCACWIVPTRVCSTTVVACYRYLTRDHRYPRFIHVDTVSSNVLKARVGDGGCVAVVVVVVVLVVAVVVVGWGLEGVDAGPCKISPTTIVGVQGLRWH